MEVNQLEEGDEVTVSVRWFDDRDVQEFTVVETYDHISEIKARGEDGHTYILSGWGPKIICTDDGKAGTHRGNLA